MVGGHGLEPWTYSLLGCRAFTSGRRAGLGPTERILDCREKKWWADTVSNRGPTACKAVALTN